MVKAEALKILASSVDLPSAEPAAASWHRSALCGRNRCFSPGNPAAMLPLPRELPPGEEVIQSPCMPLQASALLLTKLHRPPVTDDRIERPRLIESLNQGLAGPLSLVTGPAGFGKTTLVSSWVEWLAANRRPPLPSAWLSLDEDDSDLVIFLRYLVTAIRTMFPESCAESVAMLAARSPAAHRRALHHDQ